MQKHRTVPSALAGILLAGLAVSAAASPASALPRTVPTPSFLSVNYDGEVFTPDDYDTVSIGGSHGVVFALSTHAATSGAVTVRDSDGSQLCTATILGGSSGLALCKTGTPLSQGTHSVTATTTSQGGTSSESEPLQVDVYDEGEPGDGDGDGDGSGEGGGEAEPIVAAPAPIGIDAGFTPPGAPEPVVAVPAPIGTDPGFTAPAVGAPAVRLGETNGSYQSLVVRTPALGNAQGDGHIRVYDESGEQVVDRSWNSSGASDISVFVNAPHGERHTFQVEVETPKGTSPRTEVVVDRSADDLAAPTFATPPTASGSRLSIMIKATPGATATFTDRDGTTQAHVVGAAGYEYFTGTVARGELNEYSVVLTLGSQTSAPLTHVVDDRNDAGPAPVDPAVPAPGDVDAGFSPIDGPAPVDPAVPAPGDVDAGFSPIDEPAPADPAVPAPGDVDAGFSPIDEPGDTTQPTTPNFLYGRIDEARNTARMTISIPVVEQNAKLVFTTDDGRTRTIYVTGTTREYVVPVAHLGAQDITVVQQVGDRVSAPTTIHLDAPAGS